MVQTASALDLTAILNEEIDWRYKSFPPAQQPVTIGAVGRQGWHALEGDLLFPVLLLKEHALQHNIELMARYCAEHGVSLAPHGKTPMAPQIVQRQLDAGAWGVTAATIHQARVFRASGVRRILVANELLEPKAIEWAVSEGETDPDFEFLCLVDSVDGVALLGHTLNRLRPSRPLRVLLEIGVSGGRSGVRNREDVLAVAVAVSRSPHLQLAGVEGYEGAVPGETLDKRLEAVTRYMSDIRERVLELERAGHFTGLDEIIVSAGGSMYFDRVIEQLTPAWSTDTPVRILLRSGSNMTHDFDSQERTSPLAGRGSGGEHLLPALELWAMVLSRPEPDLAILGCGKRDAPYDIRLPAPFAARRDGVTRPFDRAAVSALNDQHAFLRLEPGADLAVGDLVGLNVSHPCTSFDKWRLVPLIDEDYRVTGAIRTFF